VRILLAVLLLLGGATLALLPPRAVVVPPSPDVAPPLRGVLHVHTNLSDGTGTKDDVAAAAGRAGLSFVIFTDHGDGTRAPDAPVYRSGVLCIEGVEISTDGGHVIALGLPPAPYRLGGATRDVLEDVTRLGGFSVAAHPQSMQPSLRWTAGDTGFDGVEWLNWDSEWRDEPVASLARAFLTYWIRPAESLASLLDHPDTALALWDRALQDRVVVGLAGADAHARIGLRQMGEPYDGRPVARLPGYESVFRTSSIGLPGTRLTGQALDDAGTVLSAIRAGRVVSIVDGLATGAWLEFSGASGRHQVEQGSVLPLDGPVVLRARAPALAGARMRLLRDGREIAAQDAGAPMREQQPSEPGTYRVEVDLATPRGTSVPWLMSNPIYAGRQPTAQPPPASSSSPGPRVPLYADGDALEWTIERSARADGRVEAVKAVGGMQLTVRFALGGVQTEHPYVAAARRVTSPAGLTSLVFTGRSSRPMRVSVQLRASDGGAGRRWTRSVYLDESTRRVALRLDEFLPAGHEAPVNLAAVDAVLFVVDSLNTALGSNGQFWLDDLAFEGPDGPATTPARPSRPNGQQ